MGILLKRLLIIMEKKTTLYKKFISLLQEEWHCIAEYSIDISFPTNLYDFSIRRLSIALMPNGKRLNSFPASISASNIWF